MIQKSQFNLKVISPRDGYTMEASKVAQIVANKNKKGFCFCLLNVVID